MEVSHEIYSYYKYAAGYYYASEITFCIVLNVVYPTKTKPF